MIFRVNYLVMCNVQKNHSDPFSVVNAYVMEKTFLYTYTAFKGQLPPGNKIMR